MSDEAFDDVFSEKVKDDNEAVTAELDEEQTEDQTDSKDEAAPESEEVAEATTEEESDEPGDDAGNEQVPKKAMLAEQRKRQQERDAKQEALKERDELKLELARLQGQLEAKGSDEKPDDTTEESLSFYEDPEGYMKSLEQKIDQANQRAELADQRALARLSAANARREFPDYDEVMERYAKLKDSNPTLANQVAQSEDPARTAYEGTLRHEEMSDPDAWREREREKLKAEILAELKGDTSSQNTTSQKTPTNLADQGSAPSSTGSDQLAPMEEDFDKLFS